MPSILITAFEPYDRWPQNASWLALIELTRELSQESPGNLRVTTRRYPVDFEAARSRLFEDLSANYDFALLLGQAPGIGRIHLEAMGLNVGGHSSQLPDQFQPLVAGGTAAYRSTLPLADWAAKIRDVGIPCQVSYHAGTYLCNALLYLTLHIAREQQLRTQAAFIHLPLAPEQALGERQDWPTLAPSTSAAAIRLMIEELSNRESIA
jgi:pyroglutamyl-peptidase